MTAEVLALPAKWLGKLPVTLALSCEGRPLVMTTRQAHFAAAQRARIPVLHADTWMALARAASGNLAALALAQWVTTTGWIHSPHLPSLLGPAVSDVPDCKLTVGEVLEHFGAQLVAVEPEPDALTRGPF